MDICAQAKTKPISALSVYSYIPPRRTEPKEQTYFNTSRKPREVLLYDCIFRRPEGFDNKLYRDDRVHANSRGLDIHQEESLRPIPLRSSSEYGRRLPPLGAPCRRFVRVAHICSEFYRKNTVTWTVEEGYGSVLPV